jgi:hypothetical protein
MHSSTVKGNGGNTSPDLDCAADAMPQVALENLSNYTDEGKKFCQLIYLSINGYNIALPFRTIISSIDCKIFKLSLLIYFCTKRNEQEPELGYFSFVILSNFQKFIVIEFVSLLYNAAYKK